MQRSACAHGLVHGRSDLRRCLAGTAKEPEDTGVRSQGCLCRPGAGARQAVVSLIKHDNNNSRGISQARCSSRMASTHHSKDVTFLKDAALRLRVLRRICPQGGGGNHSRISCNGCTRPGVRFRAGMLPDVAEVKSDLPCPLQPPQQAKAACRGCSPPAPIHRWRLQPGSTVYYRICALYCGPCSDPRRRRTVRAKRHNQRIA